MIDLPPQLMLQIMNDRARRPDRLRHFRTAEAIEGLDFEMLAEGETRMLRQKNIIVVGERAFDLRKLFLLPVADQQFRRRNARQLIEQCAAVFQLCESKFTGAQVRIGESENAVVKKDRTEIIRAL